MRQESEPAPGATLVAERIRVELARRRVTQEQLAEHLGVTQAAVSYWTSGKRKPSIGDLVRIADFFGVTTDYLLGRKPNGDPVEAAA